MNAIEARAHGGDMGSQGDAPEPDETAMSEPEAPGEFVGCEGCPCEHDGGGEGEHVNGSVWWSDYEAPDKPIADYSAREVGIQGECLAARYLARRGLEVMAQNWRCRAGEVDIVAREEDGEVALVEVKTRLNLDGDPQSMPELAVDGNKQRRYRQIALAYLMCHPEVQRMRFDVIAININGDHNAKLRHLVGTFTWDS